MPLHTPNMNLTLLITRQLSFRFTKTLGNDWYFGMGICPSFAFEACIDI